MKNSKTYLGNVALASVLLSSSTTFAATNFVLTNLIANQPGAAAVTDPNLVGTWGISASAASPF